MKLSENERALYVELAVQIAIRMCDGSRYAEGRHSRADRPEFRGCVIERGHTSDVEAGCGVLRDLGVMQPLNEDLSPREEEPLFAPCYRLTFSVSGLREHLRGALPASAPSLSEVIAAFIRLVAGYGCGIHSRREPFAVSPELAPTFDLFVRCGYVERVDDKVAWTDRIAPEMRAAHEWTEDLISREEAEEAVIDEMWRTMPARFRKTFFSGGPVDIYALGDVIERFWYDGGWRDVGLTHEYPEIASDRAEALARKFQESGE